MKIKLPKLVEMIIKESGNITLQKNTLKIYAALYLRSIRKNDSGYFKCPSTYLLSINSRYYKIIDKFIEYKILDYYKRPIIDPNDIFNTIEKKYYNKNLGICMSYKFLIDVEDGINYEVDMSSGKNMRWYKILEHSLIELNYETKINRDSYGRRVHHPAIYDYKEFLKGREYMVIDSKCSQPRLLYLIMQKRKVIDQNYFNIFENDEDFYFYLMENLNIEMRDDAKDLFMHWINGDKYLPHQEIKNLFPIATNFLKGLKTKNYKDSGSFLQREEAKIWIDDLLNNIPCEFAIPIHDSLIIKQKDLTKVFKYCNEKHPELKFTVKEL